MLVELFDMTQIEDTSKNELRMAVGFLDSPLLSERRRYKIFVALVALTHSNIQSQRKFQISVVDLKKELGMTSNNYDWLEATVDWLMGTVITYNVSKKDKNGGWKKTQILGPSSLENGIISSEWTEPVWEKLKNPIIYAYITKKGVYDFKKKYSIRLYNWLVVLLVPNKQTESKTVRIEDIVKILDIKDKKQNQYYTSWHRINGKIIAPSQKEINALTNIEFQVIPKERVDRKVVSVEFFVKRTRDVKRAIDLIEEEPNTNTPKTVAQNGVKKSSKYSKELKIQIKKAQELGLSLSTGAGELIRDAVDDMGEKAATAWLQEILVAADAMQKTGKMKNIGGHIRKQLKSRPMFDFSEIEEEADTAQNETQKQAVDQYAKRTAKEIEAFMAKEVIKVYEHWFDTNWQEASQIIQTLSGESELLQARANQLRVDLLEKTSVIGRKAFFVHLVHMYGEAFPINAKERVTIENITAEQKKEILAEVNKALPVETEFKNTLKTYPYIEVVSKDVEAFWEQSVGMIEK